MQSVLRPPLQQLLSEKRSFVSKRKLFIGIDTRYMYLNDGSIFFFKGVCTGVGWVGGWGIQSDALSALFDILIKITYNDV